MAPIQFLDTTDIQQIEVLKGPASVLYGSDAIGGVVQIISKIPTAKYAPLPVQNWVNIKTYKSIIGADLAEQRLLRSSSWTALRIRCHQSF